MNPNTNRFEPLREATGEEQEKALSEMYDAWAGVYDRVQPLLVRPDGTPFPPHWPVFEEGEKVVVKGYTFKVAHIGERHLLLEPTGPLVVKGKGND